MKVPEYRSFDATGLAALVRDGEASADELLEAAVESADESNPSLNALVTRFEDRARKAIAAGLPDGPFKGVPFAIKDLVATVEGVVTSNGSRAYSDAVAARDSEIVRRYKAAGLVIFAKSNTPEFGLCPSTEPALFGPTRNPWDENRSPGGSSGGAAAAVASGMLPAAHASDGGGSIRIPASACGLFGLKPTRARVSLAPDRGEGWGGFSTMHAVTRSVRDSAALLDAVSGPAEGDPYWAPPAGATFLEQVGRPPGRLRVGLCTEAPSGISVDSACRAAAESTAVKLQSLGHEVVTAEWPFPTDLLAAAQSSVIGPNIASSLDERIASRGRPLEEGEIEPVTATIAQWGRAASAVDYVKGVNAAHALGRAMASLFEQIDVLVTPTLAGLPPILGIINGEDVDRFVRSVPPLVAFTAVCNLSGQPAMSLPLDISPDGVPIGTQVIGRFGDESCLFRLASQVEQAHPWPGLAPTRE